MMHWAAYLVLGLLLSFSSSPSSLRSLVLPAGIATQEAIQLVRPHLLSLSCFSSKRYERFLKCNTVFYGRQRKERDRYWAGISLAPLRLLIEPIGRGAQPSSIQHMLVLRQEEKHIVLTYTRQQHARTTHAPPTPPLVQKRYTTKWK